MYQNRKYPWLVMQPSCVHDPPCTAGTGSIGTNRSNTCSSQGRNGQHVSNIYTLDQDHGLPVAPGMAQRPDTAIVIVASAC